MIRFVIPVYNESENIANLMADLGPRARELGARIIFVDDGSSDGTAEAIEAHRDGLHLAIVRHEVNRGLGCAINSGL
ncbi:MAG TPA: glycosyltransferase, partial [Solirubrobacteraceae bacterium]|nr:glycosyltransferase [Solirubrobacteraceae bacterium]